VLQVYGWGSELLGYSLLYRPGGVLRLSPVSGLLSANERMPNPRLSLRLGNVCFVVLSCPAAFFPFSVFRFRSFRLRRRVYSQRPHSIHATFSYMLHHYALCSMLYDLFIAELGQPCQDPFRDTDHALAAIHVT
jgi:hypothetical protein